MRKAKEKERRLAEGDVTDTSAPPTGIPGEGFASQQNRPSASRARTPSAVADKRKATDGYFGIAPQGAGRSSPYDELRPPSIYSSTADEDDDGTAQDHSSTVNEVVQEVVDNETLAGDSDDAEGDASGEGDEGVTLKDRQDVSCP